MFHLFLVILVIIKQTYIKISNFFSSIYIEIIEWISSLTMVQWLINTRVVQWILNYKFIILGIFGGIIENSIMLISAGISCKRDPFKLFLAVCVSALASFVFDICFFFLIDSLAKNFSMGKFSAKYPKLSNMLQKIGIYSMLLYRFIPFARIPSMLICLKSDKKKVIFYNFIGAMGANAFFISLGFFI